MRLTLTVTLLKVVPLCLLMLAFSRSSDVLAQSSPPANSRNFQMALFTYDYHTGVSAAHTVGYVDIPMFGSDIPSLQPSGRSIMRLESWHHEQPLSSVTVDWSRILAVVIDEPYATRLQEDYGDYNEVNPCAGGLGGGSPVRRARLVAIRAKLMNAVNLVHDVAPRTRVWVNFHQWEVNWMRGNDCEHLNDPIIDVVSLDKYEVNFSQLQDEYAWFISEMPHQQVALVPATSYRICCDSAQQAAARLQGFFDYANSMNQQCGIGLGRVGRTGNYDGCRVWIVTGWSAEPAYPSGAPEYYGILHSNSGPIATAWLDQFAKIRRFGPRTLFDDEQGIIHQLLED